jgi:hypothetical protein
VNLRNEAAIDTWLQIHGIAKVANEIDGDVSAASFMKAVKKAKGIELFGLATWSPGGPRGPKDYPAFTEGAKAYVGKVENGIYEPTDTEPIDVFKLLGE